MTEPHTQLTMNGDAAAATLTRRNALPWPAWFVFLGAITAGVGAVQPWFAVGASGPYGHVEVAVRGTGSAAGVWLVGDDIPDGFVVIALAVLAIAAVVQFLVARRTAAIVVIFVVGVALMVWTLVSFAHIHSDFEQMVSTFDIPSEAHATLSARLGIWLTLAGGLACTIGATLLATLRRPAR